MPLRSQIPAHPGDPVLAFTAVLPATPGQGQHLDMSPELQAELASGRCRLWLACSALAQRWRSWW
jgi:hypothetical protein